MRNIDIYNFIPNGNLRYYPLNRTPTENNYIVQIGEVSQSKHLENKRFTSADGTPVLYIGYSEETTTLTLEGTKEAIDTLSDVISSDGVFVLDNIMTKNGISTCQLLVTGDVTYKLVSEKMDIREASVPVQILGNVIVPHVELVTTNFRSGFEFGGEGVFLKDCSMQKNGIYCLKTPLYFKPETTSTFLHIEANAIGGTFQEDPGDVSIYLQINDGDAIEVDTEEAKNFPGFSVEIPQGDFECSIDINATGAKPLVVHFSVVRLGS